MEIKQDILCFVCSPLPPVDLSLERKLTSSSLCLHDEAS